MLKISYAGCFGISLAISSQFTVEMCAADKNCEKFNNTPLLGVQGRSMSSMSTNLKSPTVRKNYGPIKQNKSEWKF